MEGIQGLKTHQPAQVRVSLQSSAPLPTVSRSQRRQVLRDRFQQLAEELRATGLAIDLDAISVSAQTAEAAIPADRFKHLVRALEERNVRVDRLRDVQVAPPF